MRGMCTAIPRVEARDFYPVLVEVGNTQTARLILVLEQRVDLVAAKAAAAGCIDAIAVPRDQRDPFREGDRQVGADAGEAAVGEAMAREVVDPCVVGQELEVDAILTGPDRKPVGEVHQPEAS